MLRRLLLLSLLLAQVAASPDPTAGKIRVSVLPFQTRFAELKPYEEGMMDSLIAGLRPVQRFILVDRSRIQQVLKEQAFGQTGLVDAKTAARLGKLLGAQVIIGGSMQQAGPRIRIVANVVDVESGQIKETHQVTGADIFDLQDQLVTEFLKDEQKALPIGITMIESTSLATPAERKRVTKVLKATRNLKAYDYYLRGRRAEALATRKGFDEAIGWFQKAVAADPHYALAYAAMADTYLIRAYHKEQDQESGQPDIEAGAAAARKAVELDADLGDAHRALGQAVNKLKQPGFEQEERKAVALNGNDWEAWEALWWASGHSREPDHEYIQKALALNPNDATVHMNLGGAYLVLGQNERALEEMHQAVHLSPGQPFAHNALGNALVKLGRAEEAIPEYKEALRLAPRFFYAYYSYAQALAGMGRRAEAAAIYEQYLQHVPHAPNEAEVRGWIRQLRN